MKILLLVFLVPFLSVPASALEIQAPSVPESGSRWMPENTDSFGDGFLELLYDASSILGPELKQTVQTGISILVAVMLLSVVKTLYGNEKKTTDLAGAAVITLILFHNSNSLIGLATETIQELISYGKLLFPVMTTAMAAQGGLTASAALYAGTAMLNAILGSLMSDVLIPGIYLFLSMSVTYAATGEGLLKRIRDALKTAVSWCLKTILTVFTTYMSITGVVSGTTDAAALKAAKVTISSVVPVVGGILSEASEAVLVSAGLMKNAAGIYGILAVLAVFLEPFLKISLQYVCLKAAGILCSVLDENGISSLVDDFSAAMGLLLAITGSVCLLLLISTVCFMKGVG